MKITSTFHFISMVYAEVLTLTRGLNVFPRYAPSRVVPYETQSEATVLVFISYISAFADESQRVIQVDLQIKISNYMYLPLKQFQRDCCDNSTSVVTAALTVKASSQQKQLPWIR